MQTDSILFSPITLGNLILPNRIVMAPMTRSQSPNNIPTKEMLQYYKRRAEGGTGLIITEGTFINHPVANGFMDAPSFYGDALEMWCKIVDEIHQSGAKIMPQLWHAGSMRTEEMTPNPQMLSIGPMDQFLDEKQTVRAMKQKDINDVIKAFTQAAVDAKKLNFDGIEVHGAHGYLIDQFLWEDSNKRTDNYGGNLKNRIRLACEVVSSIRKAVGKEFTIVFRFSQWKIMDYDAQIAKSPDELKIILSALVNAGVDIFHASQRRFWEPAFKNSDDNLATWSKKITRRPTITVGSVGIDTTLEDSHIFSKLESLTLVEEKLQNKKFDLVAIGKALLADPNWANKIKNNQMNKVIPFSSDSLLTLS